MTTMTLPQIGGKELTASIFEGFHVYRADNGAWYESCPGEDHVRCPKCGGTGILRIGGSDIRMKSVIRKRISHAKNPHSLEARNAEKAELAVEEWSIKNPELAYMLAVIRSREGNNDVPPALMSIALSAIRQPLSPTQHRYAVNLLMDVALAEAVATPERSWIGNVGDVATFEGVVTVAETLPSNYVGGRTTTVVVLDVAQGTTVAAVKFATTALWAKNVSAGQRLKVEATIHAHLERSHYGRQTEIRKVTPV